MTHALNIVGLAKSFGGVVFFPRQACVGTCLLLKFKTFLKQQQPQLASQSLCNIFLIELMEDFPSLAVDLRDEPTTVLQTLGLAVSQVL